MKDSRHDRWMRHCLALAVRGQSLVRPNPRVGAAVVSSDGALLGQGWHARYGGDHAEQVALSDAAQRHGVSTLRGATLYVNLEPCNHAGKTPPCTRAVLQYGIAQVVAGMADPNPNAAGGAAFLRAQDVTVSMGVRENACRRLNESFSHGLQSDRPLVTLKIAQTIDGRIATVTGQSRWITGLRARCMVHEWRASADGILVGSGTALADNPSLTVRHVKGPNPQRFVLDRTGTLPAHLNLFADGRPTTAIVGPEAAPAYARQLLSAGGTVVRAPVHAGHLDLKAVLERLTVQSLLVEAGPRLASALLRQDLVDRLFIFVAPKVLGSGRLAVNGLRVTALDDAIVFAEHHWEPVGQDMLLRGYLRRV